MTSVAQLTALVAFVVLLVLSTGCTPSPEWANTGFQNYSMNHRQPRPIPVFPVANPVPFRERAAGMLVNGFDRIRPRPQPVFNQPVVTYAPERYGPASSGYRRGSVRLVNGRAIAPPDAPQVVRRAVEAGNRLQRMPYKWGGGHAVLNDYGYDCSGAVSYVLREAGLLEGQLPSRGFFNYGQAGEGEWITVWTKDGHTFLFIGDLRLDTGGSSNRTGPRWKTGSRSYSGFVARHPGGL